MPSEEIAGAGDDERLVVRDPLPAGKTLGQAIEKRYTWIPS
jgi:hypothetical protein